MTPERKLSLLEEPVKSAISLLRVLSENDLIDDGDGELNCMAHNLASWLEGVLKESPSYTHSNRA